MSKNKYLFILLISSTCLGSNKLPSGIIKLLVPMIRDQDKHCGMVETRESLIKETQRLQAAETEYSKLRFQVIRTGGVSPTPCPERTVFLKALYAKLSQLNQAIELNTFPYKCEKCDKLLTTPEHNCQQVAASSSDSFISERNASTSNRSISASEESIEFETPTIPSPESPTQFVRPSAFRNSVSRPKPPSAPKEHISELKKEQLRFAIRRNRSMPEIFAAKEAAPKEKIKPVTRN